MFQLCLAAAVANLTLLVATSNALPVSASDGLGWSLMTMAAMLSLSSLLLGFGLAAFLNRHCGHLDQRHEHTLAGLTPFSGTSGPAFRRPLVFIG